MTRESEQGRAAFGILLIDKPPGPTSHDVVGWVRWALHERSVGHCGTLDPPASGLLIVCVGAATKLVEVLTGVDKCYRASFVLGRSTTTADAQGETLCEQAVDPERASEAQAVLAALVGDHRLPPPAVSAVRIDGRRAHELVRAGEQPRLEPRPMSVRTLEILGHGCEGDRLTIDADLTVTKGTYIRSLAEELGRRLGLPAHLGALRRLSCGSLSIDDPLAVTGLEAQALPTIEGRAPKWRIDAPIDPAAPIDDPRARAAASLRAGMSPPWTRMPFAVGQVAAGSPALRRLLDGQRLRSGPELLAELGLPGVEGRCAIVDRAGGHLMLLDHAEGRLAPTRLLRFEPGEY